jgi:hypothetical protein
MKKLALGLFAYLLICLFAYSGVHAQDFSAQKAYQDYQYQTSNYLNIKAEYEDAKTFYKKNPTLQLREEARKKALALLKARDQLLVVYLTALRTQIAETTGFTTDEKLAIFGNIDPEVLWYQSHISNYQDGDELNTLFSKSDESKARYQTYTKFVIYNSLFDITLSQEIGLRVDHQAVYTDLTNFINDQVSLGKLTIDPFNRWLNDTNSVLQILSKNESTAKSKIPSFYTKNININTTVNTGTAILGSSVSPLNQLNNYLTEMLTYIKSQPL